MEKDRSGSVCISKQGDRSWLFQCNKAVKEKIHDKKAQTDVLGVLEEQDIPGVFHYLELYKNSLSEESEIGDVKELIRYNENNKEGLLPYQAQGLELPENSEGLEYKNMGTMEKHVWSVIAKRMKHNHTSWSKRGGNHLAKILAKKCSGKLYEVTEMKLKLNRMAILNEKLQQKYESVQIDGKQCFMIGNGKVCRIDDFGKKYNALVIEYAESREQARQCLLGEDGERFYVDEMNEEEMFSAMIEEIENVE